MYAAMHDGRREATKDARLTKILTDFGDGPPKRVLDVGCADGLLLSEFQDRGHEVLGIDIDQRSLTVATSRGVRVLHTTVEELSTSPEQLRFDVVCMSDVLEHLTEPVGALRAARALLAPGGHLVGTVPNRNRLFANLVTSDFPPHHFLRFDEPSLDQCLSAAELKLERTEVFEFGYALPAVVNTALRLARTKLRGRARSPAAANGNPTSAPKARGNRIPRTLADLANRGLAAASKSFERALHRGFKIYFVASVSKSPDPQPLAPERSSS